MIKRVFFSSILLETDIESRLIYVIKMRNYGKKIFLLHFSN